MTQDGRDPLLSEEENTADIVEPPTEEEMNSAITSNIGHVVAVVRRPLRFHCVLSQSAHASPGESGESLQKASQAFQGRVADAKYPGSRV